MAWCCGVGWADEEPWGIPVEPQHHILDQHTKTQCYAFTYMLQSECFEMPEEKRLRFDNHICECRLKSVPTRSVLALPKPSRLLEFFVQHEQHYPVFDRICSYLGVDDILHVSQTCKKLSNLYQTVLKCQWNVDHALRRFVKNPLGLRSQLARCNGLISRSFATQFFARMVWPESELDISFMPSYGSTHDVSAIGNYLIDFECYQLVSDITSVSSQA